jgi:hypothetical protein
MRVRWLLTLGFCLAPAVAAAQASPTNAGIVAGVPVIPLYIPVPIAPLPNAFPTMTLLPSSTFAPSYSPVSGYSVSMPTLSYSQTPGGVSTQVTYPDLAATLSSPDAPLPPSPVGATSTASTAGSTTPIATAPQAIGGGPQSPSPGPTQIAPRPSPAQPY